jgi:hypothetical protein
LTIVRQKQMEVDKMLPGGPGRDPDPDPERVATESSKTAVAVTATLAASEEVSSNAGERQP